MSAVAIFTVASVLCGLSVNSPMLVAARLLQGLGAAIFLAHRYMPDYRGDGALHHAFLTLAVLTIPSSLTFRSLREQDGESISKGNPA